MTHILERPSQRQERNRNKMAFKIRTKVYLAKWNKENRQRIDARVAEWMATTQHQEKVKGMRDSKRNYICESISALQNAVHYLLDRQG